MKKKLTFEQAMDRLDEIVSILDKGDTTLEKSLALYSESAELLAFCNKTLEDASLTVEKVFPREV